MDTNTGLVVLGGAIGSAKLVEKILGPTADYIGGGLKNWTEKRVENVGRIFRHTEKKLGDKLETEGSVPPRVLKQVLDEGSFCDDELAAEYFGGVLASSRSGISRDDRGASFVGLVGRLSTYQIRTHCFFYSLIKLLFDGEALSVTRPEGRDGMATFVPFDSYFMAMELSPGEDFKVILPHSITGLAKEKLITEQYQYASEVPGLGAGIIFWPSPLGVELFHWAYGKGDLPITEFLKPENVFVSETKIPTIPGFRRVKEKAKVEVTEPDP